MTISLAVVREKRSRVFLLAALSITIMLFTIVHLKHFIPRDGHRLGLRPANHGGGLDCENFYVDDLIECGDYVEQMEQGKERGNEDGSINELEDKVVGLDEGASGDLGVGNDRIGGWL